MRRLQASEFLAERNGAVLLDVRSPAEYRHAHIPGAVSFPLFTDEERKVVGTAYKQKSREAAIKIGLDYFGPKMRGMVEEVERISDSSPTTESEIKNSKLEIFLYCWRGGMRSGAVAWLLNIYGFNVTVLAGGYKAFRNYVLASFEQPYAFKILGGYTGSGKTELLQQLKQQGESIIDFEAIASHKGSAFGSINMPPQPSQEMFENLLSCEMRTLNCGLNKPPETNNDPGKTSNYTPQTSKPTIWLEDESQRIGAVNIPAALWTRMRNSPVYFLEIPFEERLKHIVEEYGHCDREKLLNAIQRIRQKLGGLDAKTAAQFLEEGLVEDCFRILLRYYDKLYTKGLRGRENIASLLNIIPCQTITAANASAVLQDKLTV